MVQHRHARSSNKEIPLSILKLIRKQVTRPCILRGTGRVLASGIKNKLVAL
jgi:hypothetical protein